MKIIITAESKGADIDALACIIAYSELLKLEGEESIPVITCGFTASITPSILNWGIEYKKEYISDGTESFVLVDTSDPKTIPGFVDINRIIEIYDHRSLFKDNWKDKLKSKSHIELVGACGTLIWEEFKKRNKVKQISLNSARLLTASIISNTLNFKSPVTTERDRQAYLELRAISNLDENWIIQYFSEQENILVENFEKYFRADIKSVEIKKQILVIGQIELWDADRILEDNKEVIDTIMEEYDPTPWIVNILNISKGFNYIYTENTVAIKLMEDKLGLFFKDSIAITDKLLLRKNITKILQNSSA